MPHSVVGHRVRRVRTAQGLSQVQFAKRLGIAAGSVSKIENGSMILSRQRLHMMAEVLDCSPEFLGSTEETVNLSRPWLRAYADASKRAVDRQIADCGDAVEVVRRLKLNVIPDILPVFDGDLTDDLAIEDFANEVRQAAGIDENYVVGNAIRATERLGCLVLPMAEELGRHLGLSLRADGLPIIRVSRPSHDPERHVPGDRQRWTVAHELGHLALHTGLGPPQSSEEASRIEKQAHRFAGAFLAPGDAMLSELDRVNGRVTLRTLASIKERWGVAIKALVIRFRSMGVIDEEQARSLHKQISSRGWNKNEPVCVGNETALWFSKATNRVAGSVGDDPIAVCAKLAGVGGTRLRSWVNWSATGGHVGDAPVVPLPPRRAERQGSGASRDGSVTRLPVRNQ